MSLYIGVDFHPHQQTVCWCDQETGELKKRTLFHHTDEVKKFYQTMPSSIVGIEATAKAAWFEDLLFENNHKLVVGNARLIRQRAPSYHKSDDLKMVVRDKFATFLLDTEPVFIDFFAGKSSNNSITGNLG